MRPQDRQPDANGSPSGRTSKVTMDFKEGNALHFLHIEVPDHIKARWQQVSHYFVVNKLFADSAAAKQYHPLGLAVDRAQRFCWSYRVYASAGKNQCNQSAASWTGQAFRATVNQRTDCTCAPKRTDVLLFDVSPSRTSAMVRIFSTKKTPQHHPFIAC